MAIACAPSGRLDGLEFLCPRRRRGGVFGAVACAARGDTVPRCERFRDAREQLARLQRETHVPARYDAIVRAILKLGHELGITVTAEGIETHEQRCALIAQDCDEGQGYLFGRPMSAMDAQSSARRMPGDKLLLRFFQVTSDLRGR
jgi:hypothetical protein